jgi:membrane protein YdbS with pleckstrin-like domain
MRYADSLLTEGEVIVLRTRQHWLALIVRAKAAIGLWVLGLLLLAAVVIFNVAPGTLRDLISWAAVIVIVLGVVVFLYRLWHWSAQDYMITNRRLLKVTGVLNKRSADSSLEKINDAILVQPMLGRMFNYGDLEILTAAEEAVDLYHMLNNPKEFKKVMLTQKHNLETDFMYAGGRPPSPPLRAEAPIQPMQPTQTTPPPPPMQPASPAPKGDVAAAPGHDAGAASMPSDDASLEVTQTLARLADLRDSGAITAEEYEQKKADLLSRL